jgi:hypothetical protein
MTQLLNMARLQAKLLMLLAGMPMVPSPASAQPVTLPPALQACFNRDHGIPIQLVPESDIEACYPLAFQFVACGVGLGAQASGRMPAIKDRFSGWNTSHPGGFRETTLNARWFPMVSDTASAVTSSVFGDGHFLRPGWRGYLTRSIGPSI